MGAKSSKAKGGTKKYGRDKVKCARYRAQGKREKNKRRRIEKEKQRQMRFKLRRNKHGQKNRREVRQDH